MPRLESYFRDEPNGRFEHSLLQSLHALEARADFQMAKIEVVRPRAPLGHLPAKLILHVFDQAENEIGRPRSEEWDDQLNAALIHHKARAVSVDNERIRFELGLGAALQAAEARFGDGYYNGVLIHHIQHSPFAEHPAVADVLPHVHRAGIDPAVHSYVDSGI